MTLRKKINAYFTVEASLVMPVVIGVLLFVIYFMFFQYDRCLMEQDAASLALNGVVIQETDKGRLSENLKQRERAQDKKKYIAWKQSDARIRLEGYKVTVYREGHLSLDADRGWKAKAVYENTRIPPAFFVRSCRKLLER